MVFFGSGFIDTNHNGSCLWASGTCFFCRGATVAADDEDLFRGVVKHRYDIQWKMFFFGWEFTATAYNGFHWRGIHRSNKQWNTCLRLRMHGYMVQWDMLLWLFFFTATNYNGA